MGLARDWPILRVISDLTVKYDWQSWKAQVKISKMRWKQSRLIPLYNSLKGKASIPVDYAYFATVPPNNIYKFISPKTVKDWNELSASRWSSPDDAEDCVTIPNVTSFRQGFFADHHAMKHPHTNIILSLFSNPFVLKCAAKKLKIGLQIKN